jgi:hypothetical protein
VKSLLTVLQSLLTVLLIVLVLLVTLASIDLFFMGNFIKRDFFTKTVVETVEVVRTVEVPGPVREVIVEVIREVEVVRTVEVPGPVREVIVEVIREVEVPGPTPIFTKTFGGENTDAALSVQQTADGGYIIAGDTESFGAGGWDAYLVKIDGEGNEVWYQTFGGEAHDTAYSVQQTADGGYIIAGDTESFGAGGLDIYVIKTDGAGNEEWSQTFGGVGSDVALSVQQTTDGGYIIAGDTESFGAGTDAYLVKTDGEGNHISIPRSA